MEMSCGHLSIIFGIIDKDASNCEAQGINNLTVTGVDSLGHVGHVLINIVIKSTDMQIETIVFVEDFQVTRHKSAQNAGSCKLAMRLLTSTQNPLKVHCKSKDDDLGDHFVKFKDPPYNFSFHDNVLLTTEFDCCLSWMRANMAYHQKFAAYIGADFFRCGALYAWNAREDAIYLSKNPQGWPLRAECCEKANPVVGEDQPPDLDGYVRSNSVVDHELHNKTPSVQTPPKNVSAEKTKHVASGMTLILSGFASSRPAVPIYVQEENVQKVFTNRSDN
ncbi:hypothetical protein YC2023_028791 [Brassica napus]